MYCCYKSFHTGTWDLKDLSLCFQAMTTHIWLQNELSLSPFEVRDVVLRQHLQVSDPNLHA